MRSVRATLLRVGDIRPSILATSYDVRGEIYLQAVQRTKEGKEVIFTNIGNPHSLGQHPVTFTRQVLSLVVNPDLLKLEGLNFPDDVISRAKLYLKHMKGGAGAYSDSKGLPWVREEIADFIKKKSGVSDVTIDNIFISNGASEVARMALFALIRGSDDGIMVPIPQYPLYSASIALYGGQLVPYYLDEEKGWGLDINELRRSLEASRSKGVCVRALVFINPGNPTGQCLTEENLRDLLAFCHENQLVLMADEVYQENIYNPSRPFVSARKVLSSMPASVADELQLVSMHSTSKGMVGECGLRGGYAEFKNWDPEVIDELYKTAAINLCSNTIGQLAVGLMVNPPKPGDSSYPLYNTEVSSLKESLCRRAQKISEAFNALEGVSCQQTDGAMYAFPQISLPPRFVDEAKAQGKTPDVLYCLELLDAEGLCCVPGSGFRQKDGTWHLRTTILPGEEIFDSVIQKFARFHNSFLQRWR